MALYPYSGARYDKFWKYENPDPSTNHYAVKVVQELIPVIQDTISKRGKQIYGVRSEAIIVQALCHEVWRELKGVSREQVELIKKYEEENSGNILNYFDSEGVEHSGLEEDDEQETEENGVLSSTTSAKKFSDEDDDMDMEFDSE